MRKLVFTYCIHGLKNDGAKRLVCEYGLYKGKNQRMWELLEKS